MKQKDRLKKFEKQVAEIFLRNINLEQNTDYKAIPAVDYEPALDIIADSNSGKFADLKLEITQVREYDNIINKIVHQKQELAKVVFFDCDQIQARIDEKIKQYKNKKINISDRILILEGSLGHCWMMDIKEDLVRKNILNPFRGIYYIEIKGTDSEEFVLAIKDAFH